jgi:hypothetical protein
MIDRAFSVAATRCCNRFLFPNGRRLNSSVLRPSEISIFSSPGEQAADLPPSP